MIRRVSRWFFFIALSVSVTCAFAAEQAGGIRGMIYDKDFEAPLAAGQVTIAETQETVTATEEGNYVFGEVPPGTYTLIFSKDGYTQQIKADVVVAPGQMTEVDAWLSGEFTEMEEFVVQDVQIGTGTEAQLLELRMESPALLDSVSSELMSQAGASDAASALKLVSGATVSEGKYATIRGLPDRYVNSQMNSVRLPSADFDKRAVQLDQFPSAVIESIQVSKTFTPDQQGDASGGAVNLVLKGIPAQRVLNFSGQYSWNTNVRSAGDDFLTYKNGGVNFWGMDDGGRDIQPINQDWQGAIGPSATNAPIDYKWSFALGDRWEFDDFTIGVFGSFYYERDSSYYNNGVKNDLEVTGDELDSGAPYRMTPVYTSEGGSPGNDDDGNWLTSLYDITQSKQQVQWGGMGVLGLETENNKFSMMYMYTRDATDTVTLAENTRGKEALATYWPEYYSDYEGINFDDPVPSSIRGASPPRRNITLNYTERTTDTLQFTGRHTLPDLNLGIQDVFTFLAPQLDWTYALSSSTLDQPDKRELPTYWMTYKLSSGTVRERYLTPSPGGDVGFVQRFWKKVSEDSTQYFTNIKLPFEQWSGDEGYLKFGYFNDKVARQYFQDSFTNVNIYIPTFYGDWEESYTDYLESLNIPMRESLIDIDYQGDQNISAWYWMADLPLNSWFNIIGGARFETTDLSIKNDPDRSLNGNIQARYYQFGWTDEGVAYTKYIAFDPAETDVNYHQKDVLPSLGFEFQPLEDVTIRGAYTQTVARQTFKELSPILQRDYVGADGFVGNPNLKMSALKNYDLRFDWTPYQGGLISMSYFYKDVKDPIEYVLVRSTSDSFTAPVNYPKGKLSGYEFEVRQQLGRFEENLEGLMLGANASIIQSEVTLSQPEILQFKNNGAPYSPTRDMTNAPAHLYNLFLTYDVGDLGTQLGLFYTVRGDTLIAGAGMKGSDWYPDVYETEYGTLNFSLSQKLGEIWNLKFQAKNLLDPEIQTVSRHPALEGGDQVESSYTKGMDFSISLSAKF